MEEVPPTKFTSPSQLGKFEDHERKPWIWFKESFKLTTGRECNIKESDKSMKRVFIKMKSFLEELQLIQEDVASEDTNDNSVERFGDNKEFVKTIAPLMVQVKTNHAETEYEGKKEREEIKLGKPMMDNLNQGEYIEFIPVKSGQENHGQKIYVRRVDILDKEYYVQVDNQPDTLIELLTPLPNTISYTDLNVVTSFLVVNILLNVIGTAIFWFCWPLISISSAMGIGMLLNRSSHTINKDLLLACVAFGFFACSASAIGFIFMLKQILEFNYGSLFIGNGYTFFISTLVIYPLTIIYTFLSSISLYQIRKRYLNHLNQLIKPEDNETTYLLSRRN